MLRRDRRRRCRIGEGRRRGCQGPSRRLVEFRFLQLRKHGEEVEYGREWYWMRRGGDKWVEREGKRGKRGTEMNVRRDENESGSFDALPTRRDQTNHDAHP